MTELATRTALGEIPTSASIRPAEWEERRAKLARLLAGITQHADLQMLERCPYRNRLDQCTSNVRCRNKRKPAGADELPCCAGDAGIDYRSAWETEPDDYEPLRRALRVRANRAGTRRGALARESPRAER